MFGPSDRGHQIARQGETDNAIVSLSSSPMLPPTRRAAQVTIIGSYIHSNRVGCQGAGIYINNADVTINGTTISDNSVGSSCGVGKSPRGGAIYLDSSISSGTLTFTEPPSTITGNSPSVESCGAGSYLSSQLACVECMPGTYGTASQQTTCISCELGKRSCKSEWEVEGVQGGAVETSRATN